MKSKQLLNNIRVRILYLYCIHQLKHYIAFADSSLSGKYLD